MTARAEDLISYISPSVRIPGGPAFPMAVQRTKELLLEGRNFDEIHMSAEIYTPIAQMIGKSLQSVSRAMDRAVDCFWMNGQNDNLNRIIGRTLPAKPYPRELLLYCACFLIHGEPYHKSAALIFGK